ncbi:MAG: DUF2007 domain-containing protein [Flavobacteriaceae bacterium]|nr:DUF2007 domain-containing protein [Flavobacteriaceae bacterium]
MRPEDKQLKIVFRTTFIHEIHLAKAKLASKNIRSYIIDVNINYTIGTAFIEDYKLMVDVSEFDKALSILSLYKT